MKASTLEGTAFCLILGLGACADGLADLSGGMAVLMGGVAVLMGGVALSGLLIHLAHSRTWERERGRSEARRRPRRVSRPPAPHPEETARRGQKKGRCGGSNTAAARQNRHGKYLFHVPILPGKEEKVK